MATHANVLGMAAALLLTAGAGSLSAQIAQEWPWDNSRTPPPRGTAAAEVQPMGESEAAQDLTAPPESPMFEEGVAPGDDVWSADAAESDISMIDDGLQSADPSGDALVEMGSASADDAGGGDVLIRDDELPPARGKAAMSKGRIDVSAYEDLLRENMQLRRDVTDLQQGVQDSLSDKQRLEGEIRDLERQVSESVALVQNLRQGQDGGAAAAAGAGDAAQQAALDALRAERDQLSGQVEALKAQLKAPVAGAGPAPAPGSDLYRALEQEHAALKQQLDELSNAKDAALAELEALKGKQVAEASTVEEVRGREAGLQAELDQARARIAKQDQTIQKLLERVPAMEKELAELRDTADVKDRNLQSRDREVEALKLEMDRREQRLIKAERMNALLEQTRAEVQQVSKKDQRDLHYNMASVYAKEGRYQEAQQEYLNALRVDPTDAGSHYNLGILYEDVLNDKRKAAMHYRAYLKLAPNAEDADEVKGWLVQLEMN